MLFVYQYRHMSKWIIMTSIEIYIHTDDGYLYYSEAFSLSIFTTAAKVFETSTSTYLHPPVFNNRILCTKQNWIQ